MSDLGVRIICHTVCSAVILRFSYISDSSQCKDWEFVKRVRENYETAVKQLDAPQVPVSFLGMPESFDL